MSIWLITDIVLLLALVPCTMLVLRSLGLSDWAVVVQTGWLIGALALLMLAEAMQRPSFCDLAVALSLLSFPVGLIFAHLIQRWFG